MSRWNAGRPPHSYETGKPPHKGKPGDPPHKGKPGDPPPEELGSIGDRVWQDDNENGLQDKNEGGVSGVEVTLLQRLPDGSFTVIATTTTDAHGAYLFDKLPAGDYKLEFEAPDGFVFTEKNANGDTIDSDVDPQTGKTDVISLGAGEHNRDVDAGLICIPAPPPPELGAIGDRVFVDLDKDGLQDEGEFGVPGVLVTLTGAGPDGVFGTADDFVRTTTTDASGNYLFDELPAGDYILDFEAPEGFTFTKKNVGDDDTIDSDVDNTGRSDVITLGEGEINLDIDSGLICDCPDPAPLLGAIGDRVWHDTDGNGIQDAGEPGVPNVTVELTGAGPDGEFGTADDINLITQTDVTGFYIFEGLDAGDYIVTFVAPDGKEFTTPNAGTDIRFDSDADPDTGETDVISLGAGERNITIDAGLVEEAPPPPELGAIGDRVWFDANGNGIQDPGEPGVAGVTVELTGAGDDGVFGTADDINLVTQTNADGLYLFDELEQGDYIVTFFAPDGTELTIQNAGTDPTVDSDADPDTGETDVISLGAGEINLTIDAGLVEEELPPPPPAIDVEKLVRGETTTSPVGPVCDIAGKPQALTFLFTGGSANTTSQKSASVSGNVPEEGTFRVVVSKEKDASKALSGKAKDTYFDGQVTVGDTYTATGDGGKFSSNTFIHVFDGNTPIQTSAYHLSCSQPINLGDVIGASQLVVYQGERGTFELPDPDLSPGLDDADADTAAEAVLINQGDTAVFTFLVTNPGEVALEDVVLTDDKVNPEFVGGDDNNNGLLDPGETWIYVASELAKTGLNTNIATVTGRSVLDGSSVEDFDPANYSTPTAPPPPDGPICKIAGKPLEITFLFTGGNRLDNDQSKSSVDGNVPEEGTFRVVVSKEKDASKALGGKAKDTYFDDQVTIGDTYTATADKFASNTYIHVFDGNTPIQTSAYHLSCSQPINLGDVIGASTLVGYVGEKASFELPMFSGADMAAVLAADDDDLNAESEVFFADSNSELAFADDGFGFSADAQEDALFA